MNKRVAVTFNEPDRVRTYEAALTAVGLEPVRNPESLDGLAGLLLTGGTDVNPALYGETPHPKTQTPDDQRDELEIRLLKQALAINLPVLAICRGMQLFNVAHGGTLTQHLAGGEHEKRMDLPVSADNHTAAVDPDTKLAAIVGPGTIPVNSRHHQAIRDVGEGLKVSALSDDAVIEALERPDKAFAVAVQWHPEDRCMVHAKDRKLFESFAAAVEQQQ
ncbi:MAG: gamma-glutamyl-gamma-aminobutyrate hydrolase family protein [Bryobacteraceae bacterium]